MTLREECKYSLYFILLMLGQSIATLYVLMWMVGIFLDYREQLKSKAIVESKTALQLPQTQEELSPIPGKKEVFSSFDTGSVFVGMLIQTFLQCLIARQYILEFKNHRFFLF
ncbi:Oidioi.mRNA.OKI2018_I69.XSR.g14684.t1.cds [Oikopleura dioica]|uniref:Oidioi.mRNA.OKI2018_I69.XSR.g14684.t1.cds n=1 Tax=Oikopleura dioica TaxID=34765 RepID=A0ABN7SJH7_OIKDI|nr:Oidioi.mRNA.OKI2018_I69.XSR.g14684.t1.cds [Oikopleura dioica]